MNAAQRIFIGMVIFVGLIVICMLWALAARAADGHHPLPPVERPSCHTLAALKDDLKIQAPDAILTELDAKVTPGFVQRFNDIPPPSDIKADQVFIITPESPPPPAPKREDKILVLFWKGCGTFYQDVPKNVFQDLMGDDI